MHKDHVESRIKGLEFVLLIVLLLPLPSSASEKTCGSSALPIAANNSLKSKYPSWNVVLVSDLRPDDQRLWKQHEDDSCPGIALGHFADSRQLSYAVTLLRRSRGVLYQMLVVMTPQSRYQPAILNPPTEVDAVSVVKKLPPGVYESSDGTEKVRIKLDAISYETLEAGAIVYFKHGSKFRFFQTAE